MPELPEAFIRWQASVWAYRVRSVADAYRDHDPSRRVLVKYEQLLADPVLFNAVERSHFEGDRPTAVAARPDRGAAGADGLSSSLPYLD